MKQFKLPDVLEEWEHVSASWEDIINHGGAHKSETFKGVIKPCIRRTSGYVIQYSDTYLVLASTDDRASQQDTDCEDINVIPLANIRRITKK